MKIIDAHTRALLGHLKLFLALSRTTHALLDFITPALAAILWLGAFPSPWIVALGLITAFAGYTAVYALNDLVDYRSDRARIQSGLFTDDSEYLDRVFVRHPVAHGLLSFRKGLVWAATWAAVAFVGAWLLNPICAFIFLVSMMLEAIYCKMLEVSYLRVLVSGVVKTLGAVAAVFAVDPAPSPLFLVLLFAWLYCWEVGGQNVPADWYDLEEDIVLKFKTVPIRFGEKGADRIILVSLGLSMMLNVVMLTVRRGELPIFLATGSFIAGIFLLILPAIKLHIARTKSAVGLLFNRASFYPATLLLVALMELAIRRWD